MSEKFQAEMKELDEKFAAIPENLKKRYDKHRLIRCSSMVFLALLFGIASVASRLISYVDIQMPEPLLFCVAIVLSICLTAFCLKCYKTKKYSSFFIKNQDASLTIFTFENTASLVLVLFPTLLFLSSAMGGSRDELSGAGTLYGIFIAPICILVFLLCYFYNKGSYTPRIHICGSQIKLDLSVREAEFKEDELNEKFANIPKNLKRRYDIHRLIRRASAIFLAFLFIIVTFASAITTLRGVVIVLVMLFSSILLTIGYLKSNSIKEYSKLFIKNQRISLAVFTIENLASAALILYPLALIIVALIAKNNERIIDLLLSGSNISSVCLIVFAACYFFNRSTYIPKDDRFC